MAKERARYLQITFRPDEQWLFDEIYSHTSKGGWVKDVLKEHLKEKNTSPPQKTFQR